MSIHCNLHFMIKNFLIEPVRTLPVLPYIDYLIVDACCLLKIN
jgi:hypothetical protein